MAAKSTKIQPRVKLTRRLWARGKTTSTRQTIFGFFSANRIDSSALQRPLALDQRRMRVVHRAVERVRREVRQVFLRKLAQSARQRRRPTHRLAREGVGLELVLARHPIAHGREPEGGESA